VSQAERLQVGQLMVQGLPAVSIVKHDSSWVEANFKETDLEHMRIAQEDILRYTLDAAWQSPEWPGGYWPPPAPADRITDEMWEASVKAFFSDLEEVIKLVSDPDIDLTASIPHGDGKTYLREVLLVADHNAYHLGQIVQTRKLLGDWKA
jgi:hypothetical protein